MDQENIKHQLKSHIPKAEDAFAYCLPRICPFLILDSRRVIDIFDDDGNGEVDFKEFIMGLSHFRSKYFHWNVQGWCDLILFFFSVQRVTWRANSVSRLGIKHSVLELVIHSRSKLLPLKCLSHSQQIPSHSIYQVKNQCLFKYGLCSGCQGKDILAFYYFQDLRYRQ